MEGEKRDGDDDGEASRELHKLHDEWEHSPLALAQTFFILRIAHRQ